MAWINPKTNWSSADGVRDSDFNRIEGNTLQLYRDSLERDNRTIYVATTGNDTTGNGSSTAPYATINKALSAVTTNMNGKTIAIHIASGTYAEDVVVKGFDSPITLTGAYNATATINSLRIEGCTVILDSLHIITSTNYSVTVTNAGKLVGSGNLTTNNAATGIRVTNGGLLSLTTVTCNNATQYAISVDTGGMFNATNLQGSGNSTGILVQGGGTASYTLNYLSANVSFVTYGGGRVRTGSLNTTGSSL